MSVFLYENLQVAAGGENLHNNRIIEKPSHIVIKRETLLRGKEMNFVPEEILDTIETKTGQISILKPLQHKEDVKEPKENLHQLLARLLVEDRLSSSF